MHTSSNIAAIQGSGAANAPQSQSPGQSSQGLLGFLDAYIQQMQSGGGAPSSGQNLPQSLKGFAAEIAVLLKKSGISPTDLQTMSPQDLAAKIAAVMQQQNITVPPALQNLTPQDLATQVAAQIQQNSALSDNGSGFKPALTSDLIASQSSNVQDDQAVPTKDDIAKKISTLLEQDQQQGTTAAISPAQLQQLKADFAQLQSAPGTVSTDTLSQLTADVSSFLTNQGVSQTDIARFLTDLTQTSEKDQTASTDTSGTTPATTTAVATAIQPVVQQPQENTPSSASGQGNGSAQTPQINDASFSPPSKGILPQGDKGPLGGNDADTGTDAPSQWSAAAVQQQQEPQTLLPQQQNLTAKIAGFSINPALINDLANSNSDSGTGSGFGSQGDNTQQSPDLTGTAALLQPATADMVQNQNFTTYLSASQGAPSTTTQLVNVQIQSNISAGINTMNLQLEPAELGKVNVRLNFAKDGTVKAHMTVDKPETLALLQKDSSHLQRALQQSGLTTDENSLSFDLRQQGQQQNTNGYNNNGGSNADEFSSHMDGNDVGNALQAQLAIQSNGYITRSGVNIMV